jgi:hypothetical protein
MSLEFGPGIPADHALWRTKCVLESVSFDVLVIIRILVLNEPMEWPDMRMTSDVQGIERWAG